MGKTDIQAKFRENYIKDVKMHVEKLAKQGYVLADDKGYATIFLMAFDVHRFKFGVVSRLEDAYKHINIENVENPFKIVLDNYEFMDVIADALPMADAEDLYAYEKYETEIENLQNDSEMKTDLKKYLELSQNIAGEIKNNMHNVPAGQGQILAKKNVFYTARDNDLRIVETNKYYQWNKREKLFKLVTAGDIADIIAEETNTEKMKVLDVETNMRTIYPLVVVNTAFPVEWNKQKRLKENLKQWKKGHDKIEKIVANFK